jgi:hypothetical protein
MLGFFKKLFGSKPAETPAPYKVETPETPPVEAAPVVAKEVAKKPAAKKVAAAKPKAPRKPRTPKV